MLKLWKRYKETGFWGWIKYVREELDNQKQNRELVGEDRDGNKYYQYYSFYGLPTRREVRFKDLNNFDLNDLVYYRWLYKFDLDPLTSEQK
jgi:NADH:ubiquinone oxidoreductase subunit